ncbi:hypothetical protein D3C85_1674410 [compost metagenome]
MGLQGDVFIPMTVQEGRVRLAIKLAHVVLRQTFVVVITIDGGQKNRARRKAIRQLEFAEAKE